MTRSLRFLTSTLFLLLTALLLAFAALDPLGPQVASARGGESVIAYVQGDTRDEIRLVAPDGSNDRRLWAHGLDDPHEVYGVLNLTWRPDGSELAFASTHENWCSINHSDVFAIRANGTDYRRVTEAPACDALANYPKGTVEVPVENNNFLGESWTGFIYFQGAPSIQQVSLPAGGSTIVTFNNVADFGDDYLQIAAIIQGGNRAIDVGTAVNVQAGGTVRTDKTYVYTPTTPWEAHSATWRSDSSRIGYVFNFNSLRQIAPNPVPLDFGEELQTDASTMPDFVDLLAWGPPSRANDLLYAGDRFDFTEGASENIYLNTEGSATGGQKLLSFEVWERVLGLAWLPDGSGFLFSRIEVDDLVQAQSANVYHYDFASRQTTRVTNLTNEYAGKLSISPDGQQVVFERGAALGYLQLEVVDPELWVANRDGSDPRRLVENGRAPAWGIDAPTSGPTPTEAPPSPTVTSTPGAPQPTIPGLDKRLYLPMAMRGR